MTEVLGMDGNTAKNPASFVRSSMSKRQHNHKNRCKLYISSTNTTRHYNNQTSHGTHFSFSSE